MPETPPKKISHGIVAVCHVQLPSQEASIYLEEPILWNSAFAATKTPNPCGMCASLVFDQVVWRANSSEKEKEKRNSGHEAAELDGS